MALRCEIQHPHPERHYKTEEMAIKRATEATKNMAGNCNGQSVMIEVNGEIRWTVYFYAFDDMQDAIRLGWNGWQVHN